MAGAVRLRARFDEGEPIAVGPPVRHQVEELPRLAVTVTEHQCPRVRCSGCGKRTRAALPADIAASAFGPRFHAAVAVLSVRNRVSRRDVVECCEQLFGARIFKRHGRRDPRAGR